MFPVAIRDTEKEEPKRFEINEDPKEMLGA
jgi:hypothetical protein